MFHTSKCHKLFIILLYVSFFTTKSYADNTKDSAILVIKRINDAYKKQNIPDSVFFRSIHSTMKALLGKSIYFTNTELLGLMNPYRHAAENIKDNYKYMRDYWGILSNHAQMSGRDGDMLYYAEKLNELEKKYNRLSLTALSVLMDYYKIVNAHEKIRDLFNENQVYLLALPREAAKGKMEIKDLVQASYVFEYMSSSLYQLNDTLKGNKTFNALSELHKIANAQYQLPPDAKTLLTYTRIISYYYKGYALKSNPIKLHAFQQLEWLINDKNTPEYLLPFMTGIIAEWKIDYYLNTTNNKDSINFYLKALEDREEGISYNIYTTQKLKAKTLYNSHLYKESADKLFNAIEILDSSRTLVVTDMGNVLYAQAKSEDQQFLLEEAAIKHKRNQLFLRTVIASAIFLIFIAGLWIWNIKQRQKRRFLEFKLTMARNIHDETGPALLYAKSLVKAYKTTKAEDKRQELEKHIEITMAAIRSLSHDLKSNKSFSIMDLIKASDQTLKKLKTVSNFNYKIIEKTGDNRFISHYQFTHLKAIIQESIANSIKHSHFDEIKLSFLRENNKLTISYSDNGKGWENNPETAGIGIKNMEERSRQINGDFQIDNRYPDGYQIKLSVNLR